MYYNFNDLSPNEIKKLDELVFLIDEHKRKKSENIFALFINIRY